MDPARQARKVLVIANPIAGRGAGSTRAKELEGELTRRGWSVATTFTHARGDARAAAERARGQVDAVASVGGDGTLREVLAGVAGPELPVVVLPMGTANVLALDLGLPRSPAGVAQVLDGGRTVALDVASVNGALSFLVTGVGLDAEIVAHVERSRRGPITKATYVRAAWSSVRSYRAPRLEVALDGGPPQVCGALFLSNVVHYGGILRLARDLRRDDGLFEAYLFRDGRLGALACAALRGVAGRLPGGSCDLRRVSHVRVTSAQPIAYHVDGDFGGHTPLEFAVQPIQRRLFVP